MYALRLLRCRFASNLHRPSPPPLPRNQQREFEELVRKAQGSSSQHVSDSELAMHPDARQPLEPEFAGDTNPVTGEKGGPKREPVRKWHEGDWSFKGRVSDF
ncbi:hypothetical protein M378DRAFT_161118 [Amanita muscaria Koide BX008]|uniref:Succinate dehydrogenase assembly factor 4, mitochondrial n=1 Tax=Amanita muscaria (strain Koide BX008) TaxID=946122 RepID=A0A0C2XAA2_AMAMK|nr:hypothetical protein M378DRAFT_161118 [Amanita muscaria Koide BX008]